MAERNKVATFSVISAIGANAESSIFYSRTKGEMEQSVLKCNIPNILIYRPSLIYGKRENKRLFEKMGVVFIKGLKFVMIGSLKKYHSIHGQDLAKALLIGVKNKGHKIIFRDKFELS